MSFFILLLYRNIYTTVVSALPFNGGAYTVLLNTTTKPLAIIAGFLTFLSYVSTAVVSASVAVSYSLHLVPGIDKYTFTVLILWAFAVLNFVGLKDSANVAVLIFVVHLSVLLVLVTDCISSVISNGWDLFLLNYTGRFVLTQVQSTTT